jgi:oligopeptidase A
MSTHPFLDPNLAVAWSGLTPEHIRPDVEMALAEAQRAIDQIADQPLEAVTYASTFGALEGATETLNLAWLKVSHLTSVLDSPPLRAAYNAVLPAVSGFFARIPLNATLWTRLKAAADTPAVAALTGIRRRHVDETLADFRQAGADLPEEQRRRLEAIQAELAKLTQAYSEHVLDSTNAWQLLVEDEARLRGIPAHARDAARRSARDKGHGSDERPVWRFTLHYPSQEPVMLYAEDESLRREMWEAAVAVGAKDPYDNTELVRQILTLRHEQAALLGRPHFADHVLQRRMARSGERALEFVTDLQQRAAPAFAVECRELEEFKARLTGQPAGPLSAWEVSFYAEKLRRERHAFDEEQLRPYLPMNRVIDGLFELAARVFGLRVAEIPAGTVEVWDPAVKVYTMHDRADRHVGTFYADWYPRESKRGGAWMGYLTTGGPTPDGGRVPHLGYICGNLTPPGENRPALLTHREVETIFHEFGHLLHHLLGEVEVKSLNGVNVAWDFVELPSQIMENWCWERVSLDLFARHYETGEPIPEDLFAKMIAARNFRAACQTMRQVQLGKMDLLLHLRTPEFLDGDIMAKVIAAVADTQIPTQPPARPILLRFGHLFGDPVGYAAGYYSYKWAEVLEADAFTRFHREGLFNAATGADFVRHILSRGNSADPAELFRAFMGRDPDPEALLHRSGLLPAA